MPARPPEPDPRGTGDAGPFRDAEAWLAQRGVRREPINVELSESGSGDDNGGRTDAGTDGPAPEPGAGSMPASPGDGSPPGARRPDVSPRDAARLAAQTAADAALRDAEVAAAPDPAARRLEDDVAEAVAFVRRSTSATPQSEGRVRDKLAGRGWPAAVIERALERARRERLVDDAAMAAALVAERRAKGHAVARIRRDLRDRGFDDATLDVALGSAEQEDPEAAAFAVARDKAQQMTGLAAEAAFRRVVGHVRRRGYPEGLARKVAREAVFTTRDAQRAAGH